MVRTVHSLVLAALAAACAGGQTGTPSSYAPTMPASEAGAHDASANELSRFAGRYSGELLIERDGESEMTQVTVELALDSAPAAPALMSGAPARLTLQGELLGVTDRSLHGTLSADGANGELMIREADAHGELRVSALGTAELRLSIEGYTLSAVELTRE